jgi:hypothetical protein
MKIFSSLRKRAAYATLTVGAVAAASTGLAMSASAAPGAPAHASRAAASVTLHLRLTPMPQVQLVLGPGHVHLGGYGFTPGSNHEVALSFLGLEVPIGTLAAGTGGSVSWSASLSTVATALEQQGIRTNAQGASSGGVQLLVLNNTSLDGPVIAKTSAITGLGAYPVHAVEPGWGVIKSGSATIVYDPRTATISVTVNATGFTPGAHAAHIHVGSCQQQGAVVHMLTDFTANSHGVISNETRTVTGVTGAKLSGGWYLNLHQGNRNNILSSGQPTVFFRPVLCANI